MCSIGCQQNFTGDLHCGGRQGLLDRHRVTLYSASVYHYIDVCYINDTHERYCGRIVCNTVRMIVR